MKEIQLIRQISSFRDGLRYISGEVTSLSNPSYPYPGTYDQVARGMNSPPRSVLGRIVLIAKGEGLVYIEKNIALMSDFYAAQDWNRIDGSPEEKTPEGLGLNNADNTPGLPVETEGTN